MIPVILSGGVGSRLWPISRASHPKPFIKLADGESLLQKTYKRAARLSQSKEVITVTNRELFFYTKDEYENTNTLVEKNSFLLEPTPRNSTAAIAAAAHYALKENGDAALLLIMPADHKIADYDAFERAVQHAINFACQGKLVTFGIQPKSPETGFGYIQAKGNDVVRFVEKPDRDTAQSYLDSGDYFWNSGIFCMKATVFLEELKHYAVDIAEQSKIALENAQTIHSENYSYCDIPRSEFEKIRDISVDYSVFEQSNNIAIVPCDIGWSDIGSWVELGELQERDENHNHILGSALCEKTSHSILYGGERLIATVGVRDLIIADTADALLIAHKDHAQDVRHIVKHLKEAEHPAYKEFPTIHRPWGSYSVLQEGAGFKLKRIEVKPKGRLSLQSHKYRSEHWVVVQGLAHVTNGGDVIDLNPNQSTYIPLGNKHRLENLGSEKLILIEVQCGEYLGEDDIIRYDDIYGR